MYASLAPAGRHLPSTFFQPAFVNPAVAVFVAKATVELATGSKAHDVGGMGPSAVAAKSPNTEVMISFRFVAASRACRTLGSRSSGWAGRRLRMIVVSVVPG